MMKLHSALSILRLYNNFLTMFHLIASSSLLQPAAQLQGTLRLIALADSAVTVLTGLVGNFIKSKTHCLTK